jgi:hypothetical protein
MEVSPSSFAVRIKKPKAKQVESQVAVYVPRKDDATPG